VTSFWLWVLVGLGFGVVIVRQRSLAVGLVTAQALVLVGIALDEAATTSDVVAAAALACRAVALAALFIWLAARTRETQPVRAGADPFARASAAVALALAVTWLVPSLGLASRDAERAAIALLAFGLVTAALRRATLFQVLGVVLAENGLALAALELPRNPALVIELGVALDLMLIALVAAVFHSWIFAEFGTADSSVLRSLRD
jgi:hydrogenase-4 membrane subunit HyfE